MKSESSNKKASKDNKMILSRDILIVDDEIPNLKLLTQLLSQQGYQVRPAERPRLAIDSALALPPALILLDVRMPEMDGFEVCKRLKQDERTKDIPVIFISALQEVEEKVRGFEAGGVDFITKPFQKEEVQARVRTHMELRHMQLNLEEIIARRTDELVSLNDIYERFVPREFLNLLGKKSILEIRTGDGIEREMTVMFADIRGWSTLSERMSPQENFAFINAYIRRISPEIKKHNGFIDQYYGDGIMALFPGSPDDAVMAGIAMHKAVGKYNEERERDGFQLIKIGIGLHLSDLMLGIIGTEERMQGTVIADAVNLTARLEGLCKIFGASIITSQLTHLKDPDRFKHRFVDKLRVRGRMEPVSVHEIYDGDSPLVVKLKEQTRESLKRVSAFTIIKGFPRPASILTAYWKIIRRIKPPASISIALPNIWSPGSPTTGPVLRS